MNIIAFLGGIKSKIFQKFGFCFFWYLVFPEHKVSPEAGQVVWYSHLFQNFPQFNVIRTIKGFGMVNKAEVDVFLELSSFSMIQLMLAI